MHMVMRQEQIQLARLAKALPPSPPVAPSVALYLSLIINRIISLVSQSFPSSLYLFGF